MPKLTIDEQCVEVSDGATLLTAARQLKILIPTLCFDDRFAPFTACMLCVVEDTRTGRLLPACSAPAQDGMSIATCSGPVHTARKAALELLLSEHVGDCEAPCRRACPARMNIPRMIRHIADDREQEALITVKQHIALPAVLGRICHAPCEKTCRRAGHDQAVAICLLKRYAADVDLAQDPPWRPSLAPPTGNTVAIVGAGPTGLAAAAHLRRHGHGVVVFDAHAEPGGMLRRGVDRQRLPLAVLDAEIAEIRELGIEFRMESVIGHTIEFDALRRDFDAVVLATGQAEPESQNAMPVAFAERSIRVDAATHVTSLAGVYAGGDAVQPVQQAVRAVAAGKAIADSIDRLLKGHSDKPAPPAFDSRLRKLRHKELETLMSEAAPEPRMEAHSPAAGFARDEAQAAAARCMDCDCRKPDACRLRQLATEYGAKQRAYASEERQSLERIMHPELVYEPGKCIRCGICVRIAEGAREALGLTFTGRGLDVRVSVPFDEPLEHALSATTAGLCVDACPTGALASVRRTVF